jgi:hypothetical protein
MSSILFASSDPGPGRLIAALLKPARRRGHKVQLLGAGASAKIWRDFGEKIQDVSTGDIQIPYPKPDIIVTGTGSTEIERHLWQIGAQESIPTIGLLESWVNVSRRFVRNQINIQPQALGVPDRQLQQEIMAADWCSADVAVIGQPHLQTQTQTLIKKRSKRQPSKQRRIVFFSEIMPDETSANWRGYNQFNVAEGILSELKDDNNIFLTFRLHPREDPSIWHDWFQAQGYPDGGLNLISIDDNPEDLLINADLVIGMTTMMLLEAHLLGIPCLSLQPNRRYNLFPLIDEIIDVITNIEKQNTAIRNFASQEKKSVVVSPRLAPIIENADNRTLDMIEQHLETVSQ